jgi:hypothetical protein
LLLLRRTAESDERYQDNAKKFFHFPLQDESIIYAFVFNTIEALNYSSSGKQRPPSPAGPNTATNPFVFNNGFKMYPAGFKKLSSSIDGVISGRSAFR